MTALLTPSRHAGPSTHASSSRLGPLTPSTRLRSETPTRHGTPVPRSARAGSLRPSDASLQAILNDEKIRADKLDADRRNSSQRLLDTWNSIAAKYSAIDPEDDDEVDIMTGKIICDRGKLQGMKKIKLGRALWDGESEDEEEEIEYEDVEDESLDEVDDENGGINLDPPVVELDAGEDILDAWGEAAKHDIQIDYNVPDFLLEHLDKPKPLPAWTREDDEDLQTFLRIEEQKRLQRGDAALVEDELELRGGPDIESSPQKSIVRVERPQTPRPLEPLITSRLHGTMHVSTDEVDKSRSLILEEEEDPLSDPNAGTSPVTALDVARLRLGSSLPRPARQSFAHLFQPLPPASSSKIKMGSPAPSYSPRISSPLAHQRDLDRFRTPSSPLNPHAKHRRHAPPSSSRLAHSECTFELKREASEMRSTKSEEVEQSSHRESRNLIGVVISRQTPSQLAKYEPDVALLPDQPMTSSWTDIDILKQKALAQAAKAITTPRRDFSALGGGWGEVSRVSGRQRKHISESKEYKTFFLLPLKKRDRRSSGAARVVPETPAMAGPSVVVAPASEPTRHVARRQRIRPASPTRAPANVIASTSHVLDDIKPPRRHTLTGAPPNGFGPRPHDDPEISIISFSDAYSSEKRGRGRPRKRCETCVIAGRLDRADQCIGRRANKFCDYVKTEDDLRANDAAMNLAAHVEVVTCSTSVVKAESAVAGPSRTPDHVASDLGQSGQTLDSIGHVATSTPADTQQRRRSMRRSSGGASKLAGSEGVLSPSSPTSGHGAGTQAVFHAGLSSKRRHVQRAKPEDGLSFAEPLSTAEAGMQSHLEAAPIPRDLPAATVAAMMALAAEEEIPMEEDIPLEEDSEDDDVLLLGSDRTHSSPFKRRAEAAANLHRDVTDLKRKADTLSPLPLKRAKLEGAAATPPKGWNPMVQYIAGTQIIDLEDYEPLGEVSDDELDSWEDC